MIWLSRHPIDGRVPGAYDSRIMNRRELLQAIPGMYVNGRLATMKFKLKSSDKYVVFFSPMLMGPDWGKQFMKDFPGSIAYPVGVPYSKGIDDAIRIYLQSGNAK